MTQITRSRTVLLSKLLKEKLYDLNVDDAFYFVSSMFLF